MQQIIDRHIAPTTSTDEHGVVAIEYVLIAGFVAAGIAVAFATGMWQEMRGVLDNIL